MKEKICGIYSITNKVNGKRLIGQSKNIKHRWQDHIWGLKHNKHPNGHLQRAWNKYGEDNFEFEILLVCISSCLNIEEKRLINEFRTLEKKIRI